MSKSYSTFISKKTNTVLSDQNKFTKSKKNINEFAIEEAKDFIFKELCKIKSLCD